MMNSTLFRYIGFKKAFCLLSVTCQFFLPMQVIQGGLVKKKPAQAQANKPDSGQPSFWDQFTHKVVSLTSNPKNIISLTFDQPQEKINEIFDKQ